MPHVVLLAISTTAIGLASAAMIYARHIRRDTQTQLNDLRLDIAYLHGLLKRHHSNSPATLAERTQLRLIRPDHPPIPRQRKHPH